MEPWRTPQFIFLYSDVRLSIETNYSLCYKKHSNHLLTVPESLTQFFGQCSNALWSTLSNVTQRSNNTKTEILPLCFSGCHWREEQSQCYDVVKPDWNTSYYLFGEKVAFQSFYLKKEVWYDTVADYFCSCYFFGVGGWGSGSKLPGSSKHFFKKLVVKT